jgi:glycosyltransferase involved in cell wall biosynthesis
MEDLKILFVAKPNSENFIRNYSDYCGELLVTREPDPVWDADRSGKYDVIVFEWGNDLTAICVAKKLKTKVIVRIHDHEVRKNRIDAINWNNVDAVWFINREIQKQFLARYKKPSFFLTNAIDTAPFRENITDNKTIGLLSIWARTRKRIDRAIKLMKLLPDWCLVIRTAPENPELDNDKEYIHKLAYSAGANVHFEWRQPEFIHNGYGKEGVNKFFQDKDVVLSTSDHEGFHYTVGEGALCGSMPVVWDWDFGNASDFWKPFVHGSLEDMAKAISNYEPSGYYRNYVLQNFSPEVLYPALVEELNKL